MKKWSILKSKDWLGKWEIEERYEIDEMGVLPKMDKAITRFDLNCKMQ